MLLLLFFAVVITIVVVVVTVVVDAAVAVIKARIDMSVSNLLYFYFIFSDQNESHHNAKATRPSLHLSLCGTL